MIESALRSLLLAASRSATLREHLPKVPGVRRGVRRFMPGETAAEALEAAVRLSGEGRRPVLTLLGEDLEDEGTAEEVHRHYRDLLADASRRGVAIELSVKPTQLGLELGTEATARRLESLARACREAGSFLWVDMEASHTVDRTLELYRRLRAGGGGAAGGGVGVCLQAYLRRTPADLDALLPAGPAIRLVKGAYAEPADRALRDRGAVDEAFFALGRRLLEAADAGRARVVFGTHDHRLIERLRVERTAADGGAEAGDAAPAAARGAEGTAPLEVHMLYGVREDLQDRLTRAGDVRLGVLVSYGPAWYPWYLRRLAERPANLLFALRQMLPGSGSR